jgi:hypothetical protein
VPELSIATVNGEWMNDWFTPDAEPAQFKTQFSRDGEVGNTESAASRLAGLINALGADVVAPVEAPSRAAELALFVDRYLATNGSPTYRFLLGDAGGSQKLALLFKPASVTLELITSSELALLLEPWQADVDGDAVLDEYRFTRTPLACQAPIAGVRLEVIVAHLKSNFINRGQEQWQDPARRPDFIKAALRNRGGSRPRPCGSATTWSSGSTMTAPRP